MHRSLVALSFLAAACATTPTLPTEPDPDWAGVFANGDSTLDVQTFARTGQAPTEFSLRFFHEAVARPGSPTCSGDGAIAPVVELACPTAADLPQCPRRIHLKRLNGAFEISFSGAGWTEQECTSQDVQPLPKPITVVRVDAFEAAVVPYLDDLKLLEDGTALLASLGDEPKAVVGELAKQMRAEAQRERVNTVQLSLDGANVMLKNFHVLAVKTCDGGALPGAKAAKFCDERTLTTARANSVSFYKQRADAVQAELDAK